MGLSLNYFLFVISTFFLFFLLAFLLLGGFHYGKRLVCTVLAVLLLIGAASCAQSESPAESAASSKSLKESLLPAAPSAVSSPESNISQKLPPSSQEESSNSAESGGSSESSGQAEQGQVVTITFPEGESLTEIFAALEENGVSTFDELMSMAENYDYSYYPLVAAAPSSGRCFRLEGYLFPDTYDFYYVGEKPQDAIGHFLRNSEARITDSYRQRARRKWAIPWIRFSPSLP